MRGINIGISKIFPGYDDDKRLMSVNRRHYTYECHERITLVLLPVPLATNTIVAAIVAAVDVSIIRRRTRKAHSRVILHCRKSCTDIPILQVRIDAFRIFCLGFLRWEYRESMLCTE